MKREEIEAGIERLKPWFQAIDLGQGVLTKKGVTAGEPADHPRAEWEVVRELLPRDLRGVRVLDVGCNAGFFSVEAKRRGAGYVLGVDSQRHHVRQATFVARVLGLDIDFRRMSVYDLDPRGVGEFGVVLALGLLYHCKHIVLALENLFRVTGGLLIIESAVLPTPAPLGWMRRLLAPWLPDAAQGRPTHLIGYVENPPEAKEAVYNWFLPSVESYLALLANLGFEVVSAETYQPTRAVFVCRKPQKYSDSRALDGLSARLEMVSGPARCLPGEEMSFRLAARNAGFSTWLATGEAGTEKGAVRLGTHLARAGGEEIVWDYGRGFLAGDVPPGGEALIEIKLRAPAEAGEYELEFDLVSEHLTWFEDVGSPTLCHRLAVARPAV